ncbi:MAG: response regulator [Gammaproteobacteria bacterium]|nr:response regulator [Gammaproteobacteria bacterium]
MHPERSTNMVFLGFLLVVIFVAGLRGNLLLQERASLLAQTESDLSRRAETLGAVDAERLNALLTWLHLAVKSHATDPAEPEALPPDVLALLPAGATVDGILDADTAPRDRSWRLAATPTDAHLGVDDEARILTLRQPLGSQPQDDRRLLQVSIPVVEFARMPLPDSRFRTWLIDQEGAVIHHPGQASEPPAPGSADWLRAEQDVAGIGLTRIIGIPRAEVLQAWRNAVYLYWLSILIVLVMLTTGFVVHRRSQARQQATQQRYQARLLKLVQASNQISRGRSLAGVFERTARLARELIPAHQAVASTAYLDSDQHGIHAVSLSDAYAQWRDYDEPSTGKGIYRLVLQQRGPMRMTQAEVEAHPAFQGFGDAAGEHPPLQGWLAAPVVASDGRVLGLLQLSHRHEGEFDSEDEAILQQLAMVAAAAIEQTQTLEALHSSRVAAEQARDEYARLLESLGEVYIAVDEGGHIVHLNPAAAALYRIDPETMRGHPLAELDAEATRPPASTHFEQVMRERSLLRFTWHHEGLNRTFEVHSFPTPSGFGALLTDVTERRAIEEQLRQAQKMEIVGQLTGGVAHDFNNLLTVILGQVDLLTHDEGGALADKEVRDGLEMIAEASQRAAQLTQRLLAFARRQTLNPSLVNPGRILKQVEPLLRRTIGANVEIEVVQSAGLWDVEIDVNQFENAIINLALNARDAMPDGGRLSIEATNMRIDEGYAEANADVEPGQYVMVAVTDTGRGMSAEVAARAFEPFFTTKEVGAGTGLGLSMVYGFLRQSGGQAKIYSEPGEGTMVRLYLPRRFNPSDPDTQLPAVNANPLPTGNERILLVEDDDLVRAFVSRSLDQLGYRVMPVEDGPAAIRLLESGERFDLLLTDVVLPGGMSGRQVADAVSRLQPEICILYASGYSDNAIVHHGRLDHDVEFLGKPFSQAQLAAKVRRVLDAPDT